MELLKFVLKFGLNTWLSKSDFFYGFENTDSNLWNFDICCVENKALSAELR